MSQRVPFEWKVRQILQHEHSCVYEYRNRCQFSIGYPRRREGHQRNHEQMHEVDPNQARRRLREKPEYGGLPTQSK
jgi:hypothetical protein